MKRIIQTAAVLLLIIVLGYFAYQRVMLWHETEVEIAKSMLRDELKLPEIPITPRAKLIKVFGEEDTAEGAPDEKPLSFEDVERKIKAFFSYLDSQEYVKAYKLKEGSYVHFQLILKDLSAAPPLIAGETESLFTLFKNMSHFYRVLGIERINLIKDILRNESDILESVSRNFYLWATLNDGRHDRTKDRPPLAVLYEYSGFFLNTLAGKSYLLRRGPKIRALTTYYSVLLLDKANDALLNSMGIDIRPYITSSLSDIGSRTGLMDRENYIRELNALDKKYQL